MSNADAFEAYVIRFATKHGISADEAKQHKLIKEYKAWIDKECKNDHTRQKDISEAIQESYPEDKCSGTGIKQY